MSLWHRILTLFSPRHRKQFVAQQNQDIQQVKRILAYQAARINALSQERAVLARERHDDRRDIH